MALPARRRGVSNAGTLQTFISSVHPRSTKRLDDHNVLETRIDESGITIPVVVLAWDNLAIHLENQSLPKALENDRK